MPVRASQHRRQKLPTNPLPRVAVRAYARPLAVSAPRLAPKLYLGWHLRPTPKASQLFFAHLGAFPEVGNFLIWGLGGEVAENLDNGGVFPAKLSSPHFRVGKLKRGK